MNSPLMSDLVMTHAFFLWVYISFLGGVLFLLCDAGSFKPLILLNRPKLIERICLFFLLLAICCLLYICIRYFLFPGYCDHIEATVASVGYLYLHGYPIFHNINSAERYSMLYGPLVYLVSGLTGTGLHSLGLPIVQATKVFFIVCPLITMSLFMWIAFRNLHLSLAALLTSIMGLELLYYIPFSLWARCDPLVLLFSAFGCLALFSESLLWQSFLLSLGMIGLATLKPHLCALLLPVFLAIKCSSSRWPLFIKITCWTVMGVAAIFLLPNISLFNYILWLREAAHHGLDYQIFLQIAPVVALLAAPYLILISTKSFAKDKNLQLVNGMLGLAIYGVWVFASKAGAGENHFIGLIPIFNFLLVYYLRQDDPYFLWQDDSYFPWRRLALLSWLLVMSLAAIVKILNFSDSLFQESRGAVEQIQQFLALHPKDIVAMGYAGADEYRFTYLRPLMVYHQPYLLIDSGALTDMQKSGLEIPPATLQVLASCKIKYWLIPAGAQPAFSTPNFYDPEHMKLFSENFRKTFFSNYEKIGSTGYYDIWQCDKKES